MVAETLATEQTWRLMWSHAAYQVITALPPDPAYECVTAGYGWGIRNSADHCRGLLVHPTATGREIGELSLTILGVGTQVIPRCNYSYIEYLDELADIVETTAQAYVLN